MQLGSENFLYLSDIFSVQSTARAGYGTRAEYGIWAEYGSRAEYGRFGDTRISTIACLLAQGSFGAVRQQITDLFIEFGGYDFDLTPKNLKAVLKLCMDISAASHRTLSSQSFELWYDPFSGRLELSTASGSVDSLSIWSKKTSFQIV